MSSLGNAGMFSSSNTTKICRSNIKANTQPKQNKKIAKKYRFYFYLF
uniref:Uncharacterized protein n=1 Tax=Rhizophora mucronata TaxID=61149 RepID=A0A2P2M3B5_RHIMU